MDMAFLSDALGAACEQAAGKTISAAIAAVVVLTIAWAGASLASASAGKSRAAR